ncbi:hypothetical protein C8Q78DRAFT_1195822 [Trametes maxima]|nr:hypothetical protein C8Q78DRAFT_1195822 [Trametes maxima]
MCAGMDRSILCLGHDVLHYILEQYCRENGIHQLSVTCRTLREISLPILYENYRATLRRPVCGDTLLPVSLQPYVKTIQLLDECKEPWLAHRPDSGSDDPAVCGVFAPKVLSRILQSMRRLRTVSLLCQYEDHSLPWLSLLAFVRLPNISELNVHGFLLRPPEPFQDIPPQFDSTHITSFNIYLPRNEEDPSSLTQARQAYTAFLMDLAPTIERSVLAREVISLHALLEIRWPHLRDLILQGEVSPPSEISKPYAPLLRNMPLLRQLQLRLSLPCAVENPPIIWPEGIDMEFPWPNMDSLVLSLPRVDEQLYRNLPPDMRRLSLCCMPYYYEWLWRPPAYVWERHLKAWVLTASEVLRVLRQCRLPHLFHLCVEFVADESEMELYHHIAHAFPHLRRLSINAYRVMCDPRHIPVKAIADALSSLCHLRSLQMHLGYQPAYDIAEFLSGEEYQGPSNVKARLAEIIDNSARVFVQVLPTSLLDIALLEPAHRAPRWRGFDVVSRRGFDVVSSKQTVYRDIKRPGYVLEYVSADPFDELYRTAQL